MIEIISSDQIKHKKWQDLLLKSKHATVYENLWYLDELCSYDLIIRSDYSGGMVLPFRVNKGFKVYAQAPFVQQCRWIGQAPSKKELEDIATRIRKAADRIHLNSNLTLPGFKTGKRTNLVLPLTRSYKELHSDFKKDLKKNIRKHKAGLAVVQMDHADLAIDLYQRAYGGLNPQLKPEDYHRIAELIKQAVQEEKAEVYLCTDAMHKERHLSCMVLLKGHNRLHYILGAPSSEGRERNALSVSLAAIIENYSGSSMTLDFEGSSIPSVARFYASFGAVNEPFYELEKTPNPIYGLARLLKK